MDEEPRRPDPWTDKAVRDFLGGYGRAPRHLAVEQLESWWWNLVLRVEANGERLVLRRYGVTPPEEVLWEVALLRHLLSHGFPTIAPLPRPDGALHGTFAGKPAILYPYIEGHNGCQPDLDRDLAMTEAAATIGHLHRLTEGLTLPHPRVRSGADTRRLLAQFLAFMRQRGVTPDEPLLAGAVARAEAMASDIAARLAPVEAELPRGVIHHDAHCHNVLFRDGHLVALIDFDDACPGFLVADVAVLIGSWAIDPDTSTLHPERVARLLRAYQQHRSLTAIERHLLPDFLALYILSDSVTGIKDNLAQGMTDDEAVTSWDGYRLFLNLTAAPDWRETMRQVIQP